jgi:hypothetical protein
LQQPPDHHLAELNIGRIKYDLEDPRMAEFTDNLALVNGIAERREGFVWRHVDDSGNATDTRPFVDPGIIVNLSVWQSVAAPNGSRISMDRRLRCGGCRRGTGPASRRPSRGSNI